MHRLPSFILRRTLRIALPLVMLGSAGTLQAATFTVTQTADSRDGSCDTHCSLREAVDAANQSPGTHLILLPAGVHLLERPTLSDSNGVRRDEDDNANGDLDLRGEAVIRGVGHATSIIRGAPGNDRLLEVLPGARVTLERLGLEDGRTAFNGGAVENHAQLTLRQVRLENNRAATYNPTYQPAPGEAGFLTGQGGAIANYGILAIHQSGFLHNHSWGDNDNNLGRGGAIFNRGQLLLRDSLLQRNTAAAEQENGAGAGLYNAGVADVARSAFVDNRGAEGTWGMAIANDDGGLLKLANSTLSGHTAHLSVLGNGPHWPQSRAGSAQASLIQITIVDNEGDGLHNTGAVRVRNSLIAGNREFWGEEASDCFSWGAQARFEALGLMVPLNAGNCPADLPLAADIDTTQIYQPLAVTSGWLPGHALAADSPAIDAGIGNCASHDQRRQPRPQDGNGDGVAGCDLGALERQP